MLIFRQIQDEELRLMSNENKDIYGMGLKKGTEWLVLETQKPDPVGSSHTESGFSFKR